MYYWRVRGNNLCGIGDWFFIFSFIILDNDFQGCIMLNVIDFLINIDVVDLGDYILMINFFFGSDMDIVEKIRVVDIKGDYSWIGDLIM